MIKLEFYKNDYYECVDLIGVYTQSKTMRNHLVLHMESSRWIDSWYKEELLKQFDKLDFSNAKELFKDGTIILNSGRYNIYLEPLKLNEIIRK